jgi:hypothetical protein
MSTLELNKIKNNEENDNENQDPSYSDLLKKLNEAIYSWHEEIFNEIENNEYLNEIENLDINIKTYENLVVSVTMHEEILCEVNGISYLRETKSKYSIIDIFNLINNLINKNRKIKKGTIMIFSVLLFKTLQKNKKLILNINQISNMVHPIISMIFCNEIHKHIKELGVSGLETSTKLVLDNLTSVLKRTVNEKFFTK